MKRFWIRHPHSPIKGDIARLSDLKNEDSHFTPVRAKCAQYAVQDYAAVSRGDYPESVTLAVKEIPDSAGDYDWPDEGPEGWQFIQATPAVIWSTIEVAPLPEVEPCRRCGR